MHTKKHTKTYLTWTTRHLEVRFLNANSFIFMMEYLLELSYLVNYILLKYWHNCWHHILTIFGCKTLSTGFIPSRYRPWKMMVLCTLYIEMKMIFCKCTYFNCCTISRRGLCRCKWWSKCGWLGNITCVVMSSIHCDLDIKKLILWCFFRLYMSTWLGFLSWDSF
jgi:hypothetical protein